MTTPPFSRVGAHDVWLSQGDIFKSVMIARAAVIEGVASRHLDRGPAMLISHGCAIDKKDPQGESELEYLSFLPLQAVSALPAERQGNLRSARNSLGPFNALYLGDVPDVGESYAMLTEPVTLPAAFLKPSLREFSGEETGEDEPETRVVIAVGDTRVGKLDRDGMVLFLRKWIVQWSRFKTDKAQIEGLLF